MRSIYHPNRSILAALPSPSIRHVCAGATGNCAAGLRLNSGEPHAGRLARNSLVQDGRGPRACLVSAGPEHPRGPVGHLRPPERRYRGGSPLQRFVRAYSPTADFNPALQDRGTSPARQPSAGLRQLSGTNSRPSSGRATLRRNPAARLTPSSAATTCGDTSALAHDRRKAAATSDYLPASYAACISRLISTTECQVGNSRVYSWCRQATIFAGSASSRPLAAAAPVRSAKATVPCRG